MFDVVSTVSDNLVRMAKQKIRAHGFTKENLQTLISGNIELHQSVVYNLEAFTGKEFDNLCKTEAFPILKNSNPNVVAAYGNYLKALDSGNRNDESKSTLRALEEANRRYIKALSMLATRVDEIMTHEKITIADTRLSTVAVLGVLQQSSNVAKFTLYMYTYLIKGANHASRTVPRYREAFLVEKAVSVAKAVNQINSKNGSYTFLEEIKHLRENAQDSVLGDGTTFGFSTSNRLTPSILDYLASALSCLNVFKYTVEAWYDYCLWRNNCNKETKEWLEKHTALLRMRLDGIDPTSPEYTALENVIKAYDQNIAELDQKIAEFEQG